MKKQGQEKPQSMMDLQKNNNNVSNYSHEKPNQSVPHASRQFDSRGNYNSQMYRQSGSYHNYNQPNYHQQHQQQYNNPHQPHPQPHLHPQPYHNPTPNYTQNYGNYPHDYHYMPYQPHHYPPYQQQYAPNMPMQQNRGGYGNSSPTKNYQQQQSAHHYQPRYQQKQNINNLPNERSRNPIDQRKKPQTTSSVPSNNIKPSKTHNSLSSNPPRMQQQLSDNLSNESIEQESEDEQQLYQKTKVIAKKKDSVMDTPQQIKKWIQARKRNYPRANKSNVPTIQSQMSILESKIRKKIMLVTADGRGIMKKLKNMHILRRLVVDPSEMNRVDRKKIKQSKVKQILQLKKKKIMKQTQQAQKMAQKNVHKVVVSPLQQGQQQSLNSEIAEQKPIQKVVQQVQKCEEIHEEQVQQKKQYEPRQSGLRPQDMISHLKEKQKQDKQFYEQILNYKTNSLNYKYSSHTLETNLVLENIFEESCYLLQIIRYVVNNNFLENKSKQQQKDK